MRTGWCLADDSTTTGDRCREYRYSIGVRVLGHPLVSLTRGHGYCSTMPERSGAGSSGADDTNRSSSARLPLTGRTSEQGAIERFLASEGTCLVFSGVAGAGKTRLLEE